MVETLNDEMVSAECFTWSVQLDPVDTSDGRGVNRDSLMTNERAARFLALLPEKIKKGLDIRENREGRKRGRHCYCHHRQQVCYHYTKPTDQR